VAVLWLVLGVAAARAALALYLGYGQLHWEMHDPVGGSFDRGAGGVMTRVSLVRMLILEGALPAGLLLLLTREPVKALFAFRAKPLAAAAREPG
jgi:hypothetical protein